MFNDGRKIVGTLGNMRFLMLEMPQISVLNLYAC
jgi:hypothetical protein